MNIVFLKLMGHRVLTCLGDTYSKVSQSTVEEFNAASDGLPMTVADTPVAYCNVVRNL